MMTTNKATSTMISQPKIHATNKYTEDEIIRTVQHFERFANQDGISAEYLLGAYEAFYVWFVHKDQAEHCFEEVINIAKRDNVPIGSMVAIIISMIDDFKTKRWAE